MIKMSQPDGEISILTSYQVKRNERRRGDSYSVLIYPGNMIQIIAVHCSLKI